MNRSEKRRQQRAENKNPTYTLNQSQINTLKEDATMEATERAFIMMLGFSMMSLRDEYEFGEKRLDRFLKKVFSIYDAHQENYLTLNDLHEIIAKETGIDLRERIS